MKLVLMLAKERRQREKRRYAENVRRFKDADPVHPTRVRGGAPGLGKKA